MTKDVERGSMSTSENVKASGRMLAIWHSPEYDGSPEVDFEIINIDAESTNIPRPQKDRSMATSLS